MITQISFYSFVIVSEISIFCLYIVHNKCAKVHAKNVVEFVLFAVICLSVYLYV